MNYLLSGIIDEKTRIPIKWGEGSILEELLKRGYKIIKEDEIITYPESIIYILEEPKEKELYELIEKLD